MSTQHRLPLHWSFDYNHGTQKPDYAKEISTLLQGYQTKIQDAEAGQNKHTYRILPNFWRGYSGRNKPEESLDIGKEIVNACKIKLFSREKRLNRRKIVQPGPQRTISNWEKGCRVIGNTD